MCEISDNGAKRRESSGRFYDSALSKILISKAQTRGRGMRSVKPHPFPRQTFLLLQWTISCELQKYALNEEKHLPLDGVQCQVNQEFSLRGRFQLRVCLRHIICEFWRWSPSLMKFSWAGISLETPAGTPRENDKTGLAQREAWNKITTVKSSRGKF